MLYRRCRHESPTPPEESPCDGKTRTKQNQARGLWHRRYDVFGGYIRVDLNGIGIGYSITPKNEVRSGGAYRFHGSVLDVIATDD